MAPSSTSPSFQTAISKASTLVASLQSSVEEIEKAVDVKEGGVGKNQKTKAAKPQQQGGTKPTSGTGSSTTSGAAELSAASGGKRPNTSLSETTGGGTEKKTAKKTKVVANK